MLTPTVNDEVQSHFSQFTNNVSMPGTTAVIGVYSFTHLINCLLSCPSIRASFVGRVCGVVQGKTDVIGAEPSGETIQL